LPDDAITTAIKPAGLYNMKTRNLKRLCRALIDDHDEVVPRDRAGLMSLPGIGRKCADIMLSFSFGEDTIAVDTHVHRVCNRTGLARGKTEAETARSLDDRAPAWAKRDGHLWLLDFGKETCRSRAPRCSSCQLNDLCRYFRAVQG
jgi:endonuclease-3